MFTDETMKRQMTEVYLRALAADAEKRRRQTALTAAALHEAEAVLITPPEIEVTLRSATRETTARIEKGKAKLISLLIDERLRLLEANFLDKSSKLSPFERSLSYRAFAWEMMRTGSQNSDIDISHMNTIRNRLAHVLPSLSTLVWGDATYQANMLAYFDMTVGLHQKPVIAALGSLYELITSSVFLACFQQDQSLQDYLIAQIINHDFDPVNPSSDYFFSFTFSISKNLKSGALLQFAQLVCDALQKGLQQHANNIQSAILVQPLVLERLNLRLLDISVALSYVPTQTLTLLRATQNIEARLVKFLVMPFCTTETLMTICNRLQCHNDVIYTAIDVALPDLLGPTTVPIDGRTQTLLKSLHQHMKETIDHLRESAHCHRGAAGNVGAVAPNLGWFAVHLSVCIDGVRAALFPESPATGAHFKVIEHYRHAGFFIVSTSKPNLSNDIIFEICYLYINVLRMLYASTTQNSNTEACRLRLEARLPELITLLRERKDADKINRLCGLLIALQTSKKRLDDENAIKINKAAGIEKALRMNFTLQMIRHSQEDLTSSTPLGYEASLEFAHALRTIESFLVKKFPHYQPESAIPNDGDDPDLKCVLALCNQCIYILHLPGSIIELKQACEALSTRITDATQNKSYRLRLMISQTSTEDDRLAALLNSAPEFVSAIQTIVRIKLATINEKQIQLNEYARIIAESNIWWNGLFTLLDASEAARDAFSADAATRQKFLALPIAVRQQIIDTLQKRNSTTVLLMLFNLFKNEYLINHVALEATSTSTLLEGCENRAQFYLFQLYTILLRMNLEPLQQIDLRHQVVMAWLPDNNNYFSIVARLSQAKNLGLQEQFMHYAIYQKLMQYELLALPDSGKEVRDQLKALLASDEMKKFSVNEMQLVRDSQGQLQLFFNIAYQCFSVIDGARSSLERTGDTQAEYEGKTACAQLKNLVSKANAPPSQQWTPTLFPSQEEQRIKFLREHLALLSAIQHLVNYTAPAATVNSTATAPTPFSSYDDL
jgi:hypothetical protein